MATSYENRLGTSPEEAIKSPVSVVSTANLTLVGEQTVNAVALTAGMRIAVNGQTDSTENGIYDVATGAWTRAKDFNAADDVINGNMFLDTNTKDLYRVALAGTWTPGTTAISFAVVTGASIQHETQYGSDAVANKFTLTGMSYELGVDNLLVFRNGQLIFKTADYTETSTSEVTLTYTPLVGDRYDFYANVNTSSNVSNAGSVTYTPAGAGAVATNVQSKLRERGSVSDFGAVGDGDGAGAGTNDSAALQLAFDHIIANGGRLEFDGAKIYRSDTPLLCQLTALNKELRYDIIGNGATIDCSNQAGSSIGLILGSDSQANLNEKGYIDVCNLRIIGPEASVPINEVSPTTTFIGILVLYAIRVNFINVESTRCYIGIKTAFSFPMTTTNCSVENNFIGLVSDDVSNLHEHNNLSAKQCWQSVLIQKSGAYSTAKIGPITFNDLWTEGSKNGVHIDPGTATGNRIRGITFNGGFHRSVTYDIFRIGQVFDLLTPATRGAKATGKIFEVQSNGGLLKGITPTATSADFVFTNTSNCFGFTGHGGIDDTDPNAMVNAPSWGDFLITADQVGETISGFKRLSWKNSDEYRLPEVPHTNTKVPVYIPAPDEPSPGPYAGTWSPTLTFATAGDLSVAYSKQTGTYTKIGRFVVASFSITTSTFTHTTASGAFRVLGIPHNPRALNNYAPTGEVSVAGISKTGYTHVNVQGATSSAVMTIIACNPATSALSTVASGDIPSGGTLIINGTLCYETDA